MLTVYISGPITGKKNCNQEAFRDAAIMLEATWRTPINPLDIPIEKLDPKWIDYLRADIAELARADRIYMLKGWLWSRGARVEWLVAKMLRIKVWYD